MAATDLMEKTEILSAVTEGIFPDGPFRAARVGGLEVRSHFQAVFDAKSLAVVGHEALLRANFSGGEALSPQAAFHVARYENRLVVLDRISRTRHVMNYLNYPVPETTLLFLNINPGLVTRSAITARFRRPRPNVMAFRAKESSSKLSKTRRPRMRGA